MRENHSDWLWAAATGAVMFTAGYALLNLFGFVPFPEWVMERLHEAMRFRGFQLADLVYILAVLAHWFPYSFSGAMVGIVLYYTAFVHPQPMLLRGVLLAFLLLSTLLYAHFRDLGALTSSQGIYTTTVWLLCAVCVYGMLRRLDRVREFAISVWDVWHNRD